MQGVLPMSSKSIQAATHTTPGYFNGKLPQYTQLNTLRYRFVALCKTIYLAHDVFCCVLFFQHVK